MKNKLLKALGVGVLVGMALTGTAGAQSNEALLQALVKKGVLTDAEADVLRQQAIKESNGVKPTWVERITFKGDLRLRHEQKHQAWGEQNILSRHRQRYRMRFGAVADLQNNLRMGFRLASGGTDNPISTNQDLDDAGHNDTIAIDQAYVAWNSDMGLELYAMDTQRISAGTVYMRHPPPPTWTVCSWDRSPEKSATLSMGWEGFGSTTPNKSRRTRLA